MQAEDINFHLNHMERDNRGISDSNRQIHARACIIPFLYNSSAAVTMSVANIQETGKGTITLNYHLDT